MIVKNVLIKVVLFTLYYIIDSSQSFITNMMNNIIKSQHFLYNMIYE